MTKTVLLEQNEFITQFENQTLNPIYFDHKGHLRLAWIYLTQFELEHAARLISSGIQCYANSLGAKEKFHATTTDAFTQIIATRIKTSTSATWEEFIKNNSDLIENPKSVLLCHYSQQLLSSDLAKTSIVKPDIKDF